MQKLKHFVFAASVSVFLVATTCTQVPKGSSSANTDSTSYQSQVSEGNGMNTDSTGYQSQMSSLQDSMSSDSVTRQRGLTASDQSNDSTDFNITRDIRREIMAKEGMSVDAQNVKIVTIAGKITLRGNVNSASEKEIIGQMANKANGRENVTNELQIK